MYTCDLQSLTLRNLLYAIALFYADAAKFDLFVTLFINKPQKLVLLG